MRLVVFHYHLLPGGVTDVITHSLQAVAAGRTDLRTITLICGREENTWNVVKALDEVGVPVELDIVPEIDYTSPAEAAETAVARAVTLERLLTRYAAGDALWWVHNFHVGKNPAFTLALSRIARGAYPPRMLLHIHDFPECARYENLAYLNRVAGESPYPAGELVRYAVINERDRSLLADTEIPACRVHLLVNPLPEAPDDRPGPPDRARLMDACARFAAETGQSFTPDAPLLVYPVRTIRRKNVLEMALLARLADGANLIVTLPGVSDAERPYSELIRHAYAAGTVPGVWGIGRQEHRYGISFSDLTHGADAIVSSSVQEGFGLLFINALRWRVPLFARYLPVLDGVIEVFEGYPASFYTGVTVPLQSPSVSSPAAYLRMRYTERFDALDGLLPRAARERLDAQLEAALDGPGIDFSLLPAHMQHAYLRDLSDSAFAEEVREANNGTLRTLAETRRRECPDSTERVGRMFGYGAFAQRFDAIVQAFDSSAATTPSPAGSPAAGSGGCERFTGVQADLVRAFASLEHLRLLFAPLGPQH